MTGHTYLSGWKLRLVSALLRAPLIGPLLRRVSAALVLGRVRAASRECDELAPLFAPPPYRSTSEEPAR